MKDMRKLMQIVENASTISDKKKLDESILGLTNIPTINSSVSEDRSNGEYETHITKGSYAPRKPMPPAQMEEKEEDDEDCDSDDDGKFKKYKKESCKEDDQFQSITVIHEEEDEECDSDDDDDESCDDEDKEDLEEGEIDPVVLDGLRKMFGELK